MGHGLPLLQEPVGLQGEEQVVADDTHETTHGVMSEESEELRRIREAAARAGQIADQAASTGGTDIASAVRELADALDSLARYIGEHHERHAAEGQPHHH
jgi:hypothetical protein